MNSTSVLGTDVYMTDSEVADINAHGEFESLEDLTVYELFDGKIINVENGEIVISLSQFLATNELTEPLGSDTT